MIGRPRSRVLLSRNCGYFWGKTLPGLGAVWGSPPLGLFDCTAATGVPQITNASPESCAKLPIAILTGQGVAPGDKVIEANVRETSSMCSNFDSSKSG